MYSEAAPRTDLQLIIDLKAYQDKDDEIASAGLKAFGRHLWYLNGKLVPLCLFDHGLEADKKQDVAIQIILQRNKVINTHKIKLVMS